MRLLVTRPSPHGERTAAALTRLGHDPLLAPMLAYETLAEADLGDGGYAGVVITSARAADALAAHALAPALRVLPVFAVGNRSAEAARAAGFGNVLSADGDMNALVALIAPRSSGPLLYAAGEERSGDLARALAQHDIAVHVVELYRMVAMVTFDDAAREAITRRQLDGALHFSRRSAAAFRTCVTAAGMIERASALVHYCLSENVAEPVAHLVPPDHIRIAPRPDEDALLGLLAPSDKMPPLHPV